MAVPYPTMDSVGFVTTPSTVAERIITDYHATNGGQCTVVTNLKSLILALQENSNDIPAFAQRVQDELSELYSVYLDNTTVEVEIKNTTNSDGSENDAVMDLQIRVRYRNGDTYEELGRSILYDNTGFTRLMELQQL